MRLFGVELPDQVPGWIKPWLGTKFLVTVMAMTGAMVALASGWIGEGVWLAAINISAGAYIAGNVWVTSAAIREGKAPAPEERA